MDCLCVSVSGCASVVAAGLSQYRYIFTCFVSIILFFLTQAHSQPTMPGTNPTHPFGGQSLFPLLSYHFFSFSSLHFLILSFPSPRGSGSRVQLGGMRSAMSLPSGVRAELRQQKQFWYTLSQKNVSGDKHFNSFSGNQNDRLYFTIMVEAYNTFKSE